MSSSTARTTPAPRSAAASCGRGQVLAAGPHEMAVGGDAECGAGGVGDPAERRAPARDAVQARRCGPVVDQQVQVLAHGGHRCSRRRDALVPAPDIGVPVGIGDDRAEPVAQRCAEASVGLKTAGPGGELEATVERSDQPTQLRAEDRGAEAPAGSPRVDRARVKSQLDEALVERKQRDTRWGTRDPHCGLAAPADGGDERRR